MLDRWRRLLTSPLAHFGGDGLVSYKSAREITGLQDGGVRGFAAGLGTRLEGEGEVNGDTLRSSKVDIPLGCCDRLDYLLLSLVCHMCVASRE